MTFVLLILYCCGAPVLKIILAFIWCFCLCFVTSCYMYWIYHGLASSQWYTNSRGKQACHITRVSCQKSPTRHAYAWQIGPFWQNTLDKGTVRWSYRLGHKYSDSGYIWLKMFSSQFKIHEIFFAVSPILVTYPLLTFAHATATWLLTPVQNLVAIISLEFEWEQNEISIEFEL